MGLVRLFAPCVCLRVYFFIGFCRGIVVIAKAVVKDLTRELYLAVHLPLSLCVFQRVLSPQIANVFQLAAPLMQLNSHVFGGHDLAHGHGRSDAFQMTAADRKGAILYRRRGCIHEHFAEVSL
eukprot:5456196-Amphidinium_carterae.1